MTFEWWSQPAPRRRAYAIAAAIGLSINVLVFGLGHLLGTSGYWDLPLIDSREYLIAYRYFVAEPWHWPIFVVHDLNVPYTKNIAFMDAIPLWALLNKAIATIVPPWRTFSAHAYLGLWYGVVYALQAVFAVANLRALGRKAYGDTILASVFFLALPTLIFRYAHASLSAHFLILWALAGYLRTPPDGAPHTRARILQLVQLGVAALVNPYLVVISFAIFCASVLRSRRLCEIAIFVPAAVALVLSCAWFVGYFAAEANVHMPGFEDSSANVLTAFVPFRSWIFGDSPPASVFAAPFQYEGYDYLGLGVFVLMALIAPRWRLVGSAIGRHRWLFVACVGAALYSLSSHVWVGTHRVLAYEWPASLKWLTYQYRAPGRFVWLPTYVLLVFLFRYGLERLSSGWQRLAMVGIVALQVIDGGCAEWADRRAFTRATYKPTLDVAGWTKLVDSFDAVEVHPPYDCILDGTPHIDNFSLEVQYYASWRALPINGVYSARPARDCYDEVRIRRGLQPRDRTLYVFLARVAKLALRFRARGATCAEFAFGSVCSTQGEPLAAAEAAGLVSPPLPPALPTLRGGERLSVAGAPGDAFVEDGWSFGEAEGRWTTEEQASLLFRLDAPARPTTLALHAAAPLCGRRDAQDVDVLVDGTNVGTLHFAPGEGNDVAIERRLPLGAVDVLVRPVVEVAFRPHDARVAATVGCGTEPRKLGMWLRDLWFE